MLPWGWPLRDCVYVCVRNFLKEIQLDSVLGSNSHVHVGVVKTCVPCDVASSRRDGNR